MKVVNERELALDVLLKVDREKTYLHLALKDVLSAVPELTGQQRGFVTKIVNGTLERQIELDDVINQFSKIKVHKMKPVIRNLIRSAVYQLLYMDGVPDSATCNEAVKLAKKRGMGGLGSFVNGVLRTIARQKETIRRAEENDSLQGLSIRYSMPEWIVSQWLHAYGPDQTRLMLSGLQGKQPITIRCNQRHQTPKELQKKLEEEGVTGTPHPYLPYAFQVDHLAHLEQMDTFREGDFYIQDVSSMLVGELAPIKPGDQVVDLCAAPGGKSLHLAEKCPAAAVEARDLTDYKVQLIRENAQRMGCQNVTVYRKDATQLEEEKIGQVDLVLADLPCSGLGVIGKKPDLKYRIQPEDEQALEKLQRKILANAIRYVKPGGILLYSTCTVNPGENAEQVRWLLEQEPSFSLVDIRPQLCEALRESVQHKGMLQLLPGVHECDGFFLAVLQKKES